MNSVNSRTDMGSNWVVFIFLCPFFLAIYTTSLNASCHFKDLRALNGFLEGLNTPISGWDNNSNSDCCTWDGVHCEFVSPIRKEDPNMSLRVVSIKLVGKKLQGKLSKSLADLDHLRILNLSRNFLRNSLPMELFKLEHLQVLDLSSNNLCGNSTIEIKLPSLRHLDLSKNSLQGSINEDMCRTARNLQVLDLSMNYFTGKIPASISNCSLIEAISFGSNFLEGNLPENLFRLPKLSHLDLQNNRFSGLLSLAFGNLSNIVEFDISWNAFSGIFPDAFYKLTKLQKFSAESNRFFGPLPSSLSSSPSISSLNFRNNSLSGPIQLNCSAMISLTTLILSSNSFTGPIPDNLSSCQLLTNLNLSRNKFTGKLPESFKNLASLSQLSLTNCSLQNLSAALTILQHCKNLTFLVLTNSFHNEILPSDPNLSFNKLETLVIANCRLIGLVPAWLNGCTKMQILDLSWNQLSGAIPEFFSKLNLLFYLDLSNNMLSDRIPKALTMLQSLIFQNSVTFKEPSVDFHIFSKTNQSAGGLQYNHIWSFPPTLDLSSNFLTGPILVEFGNLKQLHVLNLKNNILSGHIPNSLSGMTNLELLDLSHNNLSGMIPTSFVKLNFLSGFSVAFNQLSGKIPTGGQFDTFPDSSFEGNSHLCRFLSKSCLVVEPGEDVGGNAFESLDGDDLEESIIGLPFVFGGVTGFVIVFTICFLSGWVFPKEKAKNDIEITWERRRR